MSHTPGPWVVRDRPGKGYGKEFLVYTPAGLAFVGDQLKPDGVSIGAAKANAVLAAAAPELLAALKRWLPAELPFQHQQNDPICQQANVDWNKAQAAIAKAEGK